MGVAFNRLPLKNTDKYANVILDHHHPINLELTYSKLSGDSSHSEAVFCAGSENHPNWCVFPSMLLLP